MLSKRLVLRPDRVRGTPGRFSWLDQRLVRAGHLRGLSARAGMLYLFLATVSDCHGMSWYSARRICLETGLSLDEVAGARCELVEKDLIAWDDGLCQVLELPVPGVSRGTKVAASEPVVGADRPATREEVTALIHSTFGSEGDRSGASGACR